MKSLYESILSNCNQTNESIIKNSNIGKYTKLTDTYLLANGFEEHTDRNYGRMFLIDFGELYVHVLHIDSNDIIYIKINSGRKSLSMNKIVSNIAELELVIDWWKAVDAESRQSQKELLQKIQKELTDYK